MAMMKVSEYSSDAQQLQMQGRMDTLRLDRYLADHRLTLQDQDPTKLLRLIDSLTSQCQPQFRLDANKTNFLSRALLGFSWSFFPIGNIITGRYTCRRFVTAVGEHLQLANEVFNALNSAQNRLHNSSDRMYS